jgi:CHAT domain-containing protein/tetratricopeptide (TPR) repeat protein
MTGVSVVRRLAALAAALMVYGMALAGAAQAQGEEELARVRAEVGRLYEQGRYAQAVPIAQRFIERARQKYGEAHPVSATAIGLLGAVYQAKGRLAEAEPLLRRSLAITEKALGPEHPYVGAHLNNLARLYRAQGRVAEAEALFRRSLAVHEKASGPDHPDVGMARNNLARLYHAQGRFAVAEPLYRRSLAILEKALGPEHPNVGATLDNLGEFYREQGRYAEAEPLYRRSLAIVERVLGPEHPQVSVVLNNLALLYVEQSRLAEAEPLLRRTLAISEKTLGPDHPGVGTTLNNLAVFELARSDWTRAADYYRRSTGIIERRAERGLDGAAETQPKGEESRQSWRFRGLVKMTHRLAAEGRAPGAPAAEMFETAQWALATEAAASLAQMAARSAAGSPELAGLVRERQDLAGEWQAKDKLLIAAKSQEPGRRNAGAEKALADRLEAIDARLAEIGRTLAKDFSNYAALANPAPVSVADVQAQLGADEALVLFLDTPDLRPLPEETFAWVVTKSEVRWVRAELGTAALRREVAALRCGLDNALWDDAKWNAWCVEALKQRRLEGVGGVTTLPFDIRRAYALYQALLGPVEHLIKGKHLLIVPSGPLTQLPFQVLVTEPPKMPEGGGGYREAAWLGARQPITVLPAVSSLKALRAHVKVSRAGKAYLGFGNPLLDGRDARFAELAKMARASTSCPPAPTPVARLGAGQGGVAPVEIRGGLANVADLRTQTPLPETAEELCAVARDLKAGLSEVRLADRATETEVKRLSKSGELARYRVLHFATHGAMAGELDKDREPGLILTPPATASEEDDGYLSASEIAALKLDADWVILSACNTAARGASSAEALSGIARAFIYAGARTLLVSHWAVDSNAAVKLITTAAAEMARDPAVGRAEAMRRAMQFLIDKGRPEEVHPAYWAPFIVVGEGAPRR